MTDTSARSPLHTLKTALQSLAIASKPAPATIYRVPCQWVPVGQPLVTGGAAQQVEPVAFFLQHIEAIEKLRRHDIDPLRSLNSQFPAGPAGEGGNWVTEKPIYNLMVRLASAFDHDGDGIIGAETTQEHTQGQVQDQMQDQVQDQMQDPTLNSSGFRETGTFLKSIALLGYIHALGVGTIHLLPVTAIGRDGNKGVLGSPYAIRNPYQLEQTQADPLVPMSVEEQFRAFMEAAHLLGIRVVLEFVFRTASKDSDWIHEHPEWFYWIDAAVPDRAANATNPETTSVLAAQYGNPIFNAVELQQINERVNRGDLQNLPPPPAAYRNFFKLPPARETVTITAEGSIQGVSTDPQSGQQISVRIPGAFADWPPDDTQPPWGDVTYLRMYRDENPQQPQFNYIAYNTIRMYDTALARDVLANRPLWDRIRDLIPYYQDQFGIDGVMIDMGHAVPVALMQEIVAAARQRDPNFAFLSEDFNIEETSVRAGYNAVVGYAWWVEYKQSGMADLLDHVGRRGVPNAFFGAVENHNTPRAAAREGGERYAKYAFLVNTMLPRAIPFIHAGFELGETMPVNTGLDFSAAAVAELQGKPLALFDAAALSWEGERPMLEFTRKVLHLRRQYAAVLAPIAPQAFHLLETGNRDVFAFLRRGDGMQVMVLFNRNLQEELACSLDLHGFIATGRQEVSDLLQADSSAAPRVFTVIDAGMQALLPAGSCYFCAWQN